MQHATCNMQKPIGLTERRKALLRGCRPARSDCGSLFIFDKLSAALVHRLKGDMHVVNSIAAHPTLPIIACSGIDSSAKVLKPRTHSHKLLSQPSDGNSDATQPQCHPSLSPFAPPFLALHA